MQQTLTKVALASFKGIVAISESAKIPLVQPVYQNAQHVIGVCQNAILTYSVEAPNPEYLGGWTRTVERVAAQFPTGVLVLTVIDRHARAPDESSRARIHRTVLRHATAIHAFAFVVEGEGFGAAAVRSALTLIGMAARYPFPQKVFSRVEDAVPWMLSRPNKHETVAPDAVRLIKGAHSLRSELRSVSTATG